MTNTITTFALPSKGVIAEPTVNFLRDCGLRIEKPNQRQYTGVIPVIPSVAVLFQRVTDVLYKVADGTAQIGITGLDVAREHGHDDVVVIHDHLGYGHCSLVVAVPETWVDVDSVADLLDVALDFRDQKRRNIRIATKYPSLSRQFLHNCGVHHFTLVKAEGAIEAAPTLGYADVIIDLTQTGTTLRENRLKVLRDGTIIESQACLVGNRSALRDDLGVLETVRVLLEYIDAAQLGREFVQIVANIPGVTAAAVADKLTANPSTRGLQGPTIAPILGDGVLGGDGCWFTVTVVVSVALLLVCVEYIRLVGGVHLVVSPVRYVFLDKSPSFARLVSLL